MGTGGKGPAFTSTQGRPPGGGYLWSDRSKGKVWGGLQSKALPCPTA